MSTSSTSTPWADLVDPKPVILRGTNGRELRFATEAERAAFVHRVAVGRCYQVRDTVRLAAADMRDLDQLAR